MARESDERVTFSFGENWQRYLAKATDSQLAVAQGDIEDWLGAERVAGQTVLDIGSGSGVHSLAFHRLGAKQLRSFDYDPASVEATRSIWEESGRPDNWIVSHGSVLDREFVESLGLFDVVYSWGVLHHTGALWEAMDNAFARVRPGGTIWIAIYKKGPRYPRDLALKQRYNAASPLGKRWLVLRRIVRLMLGRLIRRQNPFTWNRPTDRGMTPYFDIIDWLGGLPYEVATEDEILQFARERGFSLDRIHPFVEGGCSSYRFSAPTNSR